MFHTTKLAGALIAAAIVIGVCAPAALAQPDLRSPDAVDAARRAQQTLDQHATRQASGGGFDWASAGIGAAAGGGLVLILVAGLGGSQRARITTRPSTAKGGEEL